jgi:hypothetical protein
LTEPGDRWIVIRPNGEVEEVSFPPEDELGRVELPELRVQEQGSALAIRWTLTLGLCAVLLAGVIWAVASLIRLAF